MRHKQKTAKTASVGKVRYRTNKKYATREQWLRALAELLVPMFAAMGYVLPSVRGIRMSCGWCSTGMKGRRKAEVWPLESSADHSFEIFISPKYDDPISVGESLIHEMCHIAVGLDKKHGKEFKKCALAMGLTGKMTATIPSPELEKTLKSLTKRLGRYPHAELRGGANEYKKQDARLVKLACPSCGYKVYTSKKWIEGAGAPICPTCQEEFQENSRRIKVGNAANGA
jgi:hypothetical protein